MIMAMHGMCTCVWQSETDDILGLLHPLFALACDSISFLRLLANRYMHREEKSQLSNMFFLSTKIGCPLTGVTLWLTLQTRFATNFRGVRGEGCCPFSLTSNSYDNQVNLAALMTDLRWCILASY